MISPSPAMPPDAFAAAIRDVPDFPTPGIVFKDITPLLADPALFRAAVDRMATPFAAMGVTHVVAIESRGFLFGAPLALALRAALVPMRKQGKLPHRTVRTEYGLEYGAGVLEVHADACGPGDRALIVDDVLATGGTAAAAAELVERLGAVVIGYSFLLELAFLHGRGKLAGRPTEVILSY